MAELPSASEQSVTDEQWEQLVAKERAVKVAIDDLFKAREQLKKNDENASSTEQILQEQQEKQQKLQDKINEFNAMSAKKKAVLSQQQQNEYLNAQKQKKGTDGFIKTLQEEYNELIDKGPEDHIKIRDARVQYQQALAEEVSFYQEIFKTADYDLSEEDVREILSIKDLLYSSVPALQHIDMPWIKKGELLNKDLVKMLFPEAKDADIVKARFLSVFWATAKPQLHPDLPDYISSDSTVPEAWTGQITDDFLHLMPDVKMPRLTLEDARVEGTVLFSRMIAKAVVVQTYRERLPELRSILKEDLIDPNTERGGDTLALRAEIEQQAISRVEPYYGGGVAPEKDKNKEGEERSEQYLEAAKKGYIEAYSEEVSSMIKSEASPLFQLVTGRIRAQIRGTEAESPYYVPLPPEEGGGIAGDEEEWREEQDELWDSVSIEAEGYS